jgi:hypothetical protein
MKNKITLLAALILISCAFAFGTDMVVNNGYDPGAMRTDGTNADSPVFPGAVTVTGKLTANDGAEFLGTASAVKILGNPAAPVTSTDGKGGLDIWNQYLLLGANTGVSNERGATSDKAAIISFPHYLAAEQPVTLMRGYAINGQNYVYFGGGDTGGNAARTIRFYTAANSTTLVGTTRMEIFGDGTVDIHGRLLIATTTAAVDSAVKFKLNGGMEISPGGFAVIGSNTRMAGYDLTVASGAYLANVVATGTLTIPLVAPADPQPGMIWFEP